MKKAGLDPEAPGYKHYLQAFRYRLPPHGGCGSALINFVEKTIGLSNIKEAILFPTTLTDLALKVVPKPAV